MLHILLGPDHPDKQKLLLKLRQKYLTGPDADKFDYTVLDGRRIDAPGLKAALLDLPAVARQRLVVVRGFDRLNDQCKDIIIAFAGSAAAHCALVLESDKAGKADRLVKALARTADVKVFAAAAPGNVFDVTRLMERRQTPDALKKLHGLFEAGDHPLQVMGGLVWFWGKGRQRLDDVRFRSGLDALEAADVNIKRSRMKPEHAVEMCVVRLCELL